ncbi:MAG: dihydroorotase, partial [Thermomicrobiales bacterium]
MTGSNWLISNGRIIDPSNDIDRIADLKIVDGVVAEIGTGLEGSGDVFDATGMIVTPGWIDVHVHLRVPGYEQKETIASGTAAAAAGGFTAVACMPNTKPALDSSVVLHDLADTVDREGLVRVFPIASITQGRTGQEAVDFDAVIAAGAIGWSDDGDTTADSLIMRHALEASKRLNRPVIVHCEDKAIAHGSMHEGDVSHRLGLSGIPAAAEEIIIARDLMLAELTGGWLHVCHVSTGRGAELIAEAKKRGVRVTAEVMPHHLAMSDEWVGGSRSLHNTVEPDVSVAKPGSPNTKVNPPLRPIADTIALLDALKAGVFDCLGTDHAPHEAATKQDTDFEHAAMGLSGSEFAFPLTWALVRAGHLTERELIRLWTTAPATILRKILGTLTLGTSADVSVFDPERTWTVSSSTL